MSVNEKKTDRLIVLTIAALVLPGVICIAVMVFFSVIYYDTESSNDDGKITKEQVLLFLENTYGDGFECVDFKQPKGPDDYSECIFKDKYGNKFKVRPTNLTEGTTYTMRYGYVFYESGIAESKNICEKIKNAGFAETEWDDALSLRVNVNSEKEAAEAGRLIWELCHDEENAIPFISKHYVDKGSAHKNQGIENEKFYIVLHSGGHILQYFPLPVMTDEGLHSSIIYESADDCAYAMEAYYRERVNT